MDQEKPLFSDKMQYVIGGIISVALALLYLGFSQPRDLPDAEAPEVRAVETEAVETDDVVSEAVDAEAAQPLTEVTNKD